jgi:hypothetical protein
MLTLKQKQEIAEDMIIWLLSAKQVADKMKIPFIYVHNFSLSGEFKEYEKKWVYKKALTKHQDLFIDTDIDEDPERLLDF